MNEPDRQQENNVVHDQFNAGHDQLVGNRDVNIVENNQGTVNQKPVNVNFPTNATRLGCVTINIAVTVVSAVVFLLTGTNLLYNGTSSSPTPTPTPNPTLTPVPVTPTPVPPAGPLLAGGFWAIAALLILAISSISLLWFFIAWLRQRKLYTGGTRFDH